ncbi:MAG: hypothetical protein IKC32_06885 [Clostridia bacterium]|nr:hypothetical protein [Clostridia bacterium]
MDYREQRRAEIDAFRAKEKAYSEVIECLKKSFLRYEGMRLPAKGGLNDEEFEQAYSVMKKEIERLRNLYAIIEYDEKRIYCHSSHEAKFKEKCGKSVEEFKKTINLAIGAISRTEDLISRIKVAAPEGGEDPVLLEAQYVLRANAVLESPELKEAVSILDLLRGYNTRILDMEDAYFEVFRSDKMMKMEVGQNLAKSLTKYDIESLKLYKLLLIPGAIIGLIILFFTFEFEQIGIFEIVVCGMGGLVTAPFIGGALFLLARLGIAILKYINEIVASNQAKRDNAAFLAELASDTKTYQRIREQHRIAGSIIMKAAECQLLSLASIVKQINECIKACPRFAKRVNELKQMKHILFGRASSFFDAERKYAEERQRAIELRREREAEEKERRKQEEFERLLDSYIERIERAETQTAIAVASAALGIAKSNNAIAEAEEAKAKALRDIADSLK